jgi:hypothetical protein
MSEQPTKTFTPEELEAFRAKRRLIPRPPNVDPKAAASVGYVHWAAETAGRLWCDRERAFLIEVMGSTLKDIRKELLGEIETLKADNAELRKQLEGRGLFYAK